MEKCYTQILIIYVLRIAMIPRLLSYVVLLSAK